MSDVADPDDLPHARSLRARWPGLVWAIPLSALILVVVLGAHAFLNRGVTVVISFDTVAGVKIGDTKIVYQGYEVGHVTKVDVERPSRRIEVTATLDRRAEPVLRTGTLFWLVGVKPDLGDIASVKGAIAGPTIGIAPSFDGAPTRYFHGLSQEPAVLPGTPGTPYVLIARSLGAIKARSTVRYDGQEVGKVTATAFDGPGRFRIGIFIDRPYDLLVRPGTIFWPAAPFELSLGAGSITARSVDPSALLSGGVNMDLAADDPPARSPPYARFPLYDSRADAEAGPPGPSIPYAMTFTGAGGDLVRGAPVTLLGFRIGTVRARGLLLDGPDGLPATRVIVGLDASRLSAAAPDAPPAAARDGADAAVRRLLARGYRAELVQQPALIGRYAVAFVRQAGRPAALLPGTPPGIPVRGGGADPGQQVQEILGKINRVPIERIGQDIAATTARLRALTSSPKVDQSLDHLHATLANVDAITAEVKPQVGPLVARLREAATQASAAAGAARSLLAGDGADPDAALPAAIRELTDAAGSIRALADYLGRHPEALVKGKGGNKLRKAK